VVRDREAPHETIGDEDYGACVVSSLQNRMAHWSDYARFGAFANQGGSMTAEARQKLPATALSKSVLVQRIYPHPDRDGPSCFSSHTCRAMCPEPVSPSFPHESVGGYARELVPSSFSESGLSWGQRVRKSGEASKGFARNLSAFAIRSLNVD